MKKKGKFDKLLLKAVDEDLKRVFGEIATLVIYNYLENNLSLKQEKIPEKIEVFAEGLDKFFSSGARVVEKIILENLYSNFGFTYRTKEGYSFVDYVNELKNSIKNNK